MAIPLRNPCKYCLTKPACRRPCSDLENHIEFSEVCGYILGLLFSVILILSIPIFTYKAGYKIESLIGFLIYLLCIYCWMYITHKKRPDELNELTTGERIFIIGIFPYAVFIVPIISFFCDKLNANKFFFRYHKSINPYIKSKKDF